MASRASCRVLRGESCAGGDDTYIESSEKVESVGATDLPNQGCDELLVSPVKRTFKPF